MSITSWYCHLPTLVWKRERGTKGESFNLSWKFSYEDEKTLDSIKTLIHNFRWNNHRSENRIKSSYKRSMIIYRNFWLFNLEMKWSEWKLRNIFDLAFSLKCQKFGIDRKSIGLIWFILLFHHPPIEIRRKEKSFGTLETTEENHLFTYFLYHGLQKRMLSIDEENRTDSELIPVLLSFARRIERQRKFFSSWERKVNPCWFSSQTTMKSKLSMIWHRFLEQCLWSSVKTKFLLTWSNVFKLTAKQAFEMRFHILTTFRLTKSFMKDKLCAWFGEKRGKHSFTLKAKHACLDFSSMRRKKVTLTHRF